MPFLQKTSEHAGSDKHCELILNCVCLAFRCSEIDPLNTLFSMFATKQSNETVEKALVRKMLKKSSHNWLKNSQNIAKM
jgi:hypothetical protein